MRWQFDPVGRLLLPVGEQRAVGDLSVSLA